MKEGDLAREATSTSSLKHDDFDIDFFSIVYTCYHCEQINCYGLLPPEYAY